MEISNWTSDVRHVHGRLNFVADALTRQHSSTRGASGDRDALLQTDSLSLQFETIDHALLAKDQQLCPNVAAHRQEKCVTSLNLQGVEFTPGIFLFRDVTPNKKARPIRNNFIRRKEQIKGLRPLAIYLGSRRNILPRLILVMYLIKCHSSVL